MTDSEGVMEAITEPCWKKLFQQQTGTDGSVQLREN